MISFLRNFLGNIIIFFDWLFSPKRVKRDEQAQAEVDQQLQALTLYQFRACPFCVKVRRNMKRLSLPIKIKDAMNDPAARAELQVGGGVIKVPCLRIDEGTEVRWMYESSDIVSYLDKRFAA